MFRDDLGIDELINKLILQKEILSKETKTPNKTKIAYSSFLVVTRPTDTKYLKMVLSAVLSDAECYECKTSNHN